MFYDLDYEVQTPLKIYSPCFVNLAHRKDIKDEKEARKEIESYLEKVNKVNGVFIPIFSNTLFSDIHGQEFWKSILKFIWKYKDD